MSDPNNETIETAQTSQPATPTAPATPSVEELQEALAGEKALREMAESDAMNAKRDVIAIKTGKKRADVTPAEATAPVPAPVAPATPAPQPDTAAILAALEEQKRITAELMRSVRPGQAMPTGGAGYAESPAPKPAGYWSEAQKAVLKAKGWSDEKIKRAENTARTGSGSSTKTPEDYGVSTRRLY